MDFPITYEARRTGKLEMLTVVKSKGKWIRYKIYGESDSDEDFNQKNIFDDPDIGITYMGIGNHQSTDVDEVKVTENASSDYVNKLIVELKKNTINYS